MKTKRLAVNRSLFYRQQSTKLAATHCMGKLTAANEIGSRKAHKREKSLEQPMKEASYAARAPLVGRRCKRKQPPKVASVASKIYL
jgi:hypothetical protein